MYELDSATWRHQPSKMARVEQKVLSYMLYGKDMTMSSALIYIQIDKFGMYELDSAIWCHQPTKMARVEQKVLPYMPQGREI